MMSGPGRGAEQEGAEIRSRVDSSAQCRSSNKERTRAIPEMEAHELRRGGEGGLPQTLGSTSDSGTDRRRRNPQRGSQGQQVRAVRVEPAGTGSAAFAGGSRWHRRRRCRTPLRAAAKRIQARRLVVAGAPAPGYTSWPWPGPPRAPRPRLADPRLPGDQAAPRPSQPAFLLRHAPVLRAIRRRQTMQAVRARGTVPRNRLRCTPTGTEMIEALAEDDERLDGARRAAQLDLAESSFHVKILLDKRLRRVADHDHALGVVLQPRGLVRHHADDAVVVSTTRSVCTATGVQGDVSSTPKRCARFRIARIIRGRCGPPGAHRPRGRRGIRSGRAARRPAGPRSRRRSP